MRIQLPWGQETIGLELPETWTVITPARDAGTAAGDADPLAVIAGALAAPADAAPLAHRAGVAFNRREAGRRLEAPVDAIIVNSHPMDLNFKQSMKCVGNSLPALRPGGVIMGFLRAERGLDDIVAPEKGKPSQAVRAKAHRKSRDAIDKRPVSSGVPGLAKDGPAGKRGN